MQIWNGELSGTQRLKKTILPHESSQLDAKHSKVCEQHLAC